MKKSFIPTLATSILAIIAFLLMFGPLLHLIALGPVHARLYAFHHTYLAAGVVSLPIIGIMFLYLSIFIYHRRLVAAIISSWASLLLLVYMLLLYPQGKITPPIVALVIVYIGLMAARYKEFSVRNSLEGSKPRLLRIAAITTIGFFYGVVGFLFLGSVFFHAHFTPLSAIDLTIDSLTGFNGAVVEPTRLGQLFVDSLGGIGIVIFILLLNSLFRPLRIRLLSHQHENREKAAQIIKKKSASSEDFFKLWPEDKLYYFSKDEASFIAYKPSGRTAIVLGDPVGNKEDFSALVDEFVAYHASLGWSVGVINASPAGQKLYKQAGLSSIAIGNEGVIDTEQFVRHTKSSKHFRYVSNKAKRDSLEVIEWASPTREQLAQLREISKDWLGRGNRREYTFFMGYFDSHYLQQCRIFVLVQQGTPVGYLNLIPSFYPGHASLDHLRGKGNISPVGMHFLLMRAIETLHGEKTAALNIGLSPLGGIQKEETELASRLTLRLVRILGASYYSFQGLEQFKNKFKPQWIPQSIIYSGRLTNLIGITRDIERASAFGSGGLRSVFISTLLGTILLTLGLYFILA